MFFVSFLYCSEGRIIIGSEKDGYKNTAVFHNVKKLSSVSGLSIDGSYLPTRFLALSSMSHLVMIKL